MIPLNIKMINFFSHSESEIDFTKFNSALLIGNTEGDYTKSNGSGKCLSGNTILTDAYTGEKTSVKELHENFRDFYVWGLDEDLKLRPAKVVATQVSGVKSMLEVTMVSGISERVSKTHPILSDDLNCKKASLLTEGDFVATPRSLGVICPKTTLEAPEARLLGLFAAEGGLTGMSPKFTNADEEIVEVARKDVKDIFGGALSKQELTYTITSANDRRGNGAAILKRMQELGISLEEMSPNNWSRIKALQHALNYDKLLSFNDPIITRAAKSLSSARASRDFFKKYNLMGKKAIDKTLPTIFFSESKENVGAFLGMFFSGDGYIANTEKSREVSFRLESRQLAYDIQSLLLRFGVTGTVRRKLIAKKHNSLTLSLHTEAGNFDRFFDLVEGHVYGPKKARLLAMRKKIQSIRGNPNKDVVPSSLFRDEIQESIKSGAFYGNRDRFNLSRSQIRNKNMSRSKLGKYAAFMKSDRLTALSNADIYWDKVKAIKEIPDEQTYDIQIDNHTKLYALNGFITHNSVIFEGILWCLFNKSRSAMMDDIIRWGESICAVAMEFKHEDKVYRVKRTRNRVNSTSEVELHCLDKAGDWIDKSGSTSGSTNKKIEETIRLDHKTFVNSIYFRQNDISEFAEVEASRKKEILKSIVDVSRWDSYEKEAKKKAKELSMECKILKKSVEDYDVTFEELEDVRLNVSQSKERVGELQSKRSAYSKDISSLEVKYSKLKSSLDTDAYDKATEEILILNEKRGRLLGQVTDCKKRIFDLETEEAPILVLAGKLELYLKEKVLEEVDELKVEDLTSELSFYKVEKASSQELIRSLDDIEIAQDRCYVCSQDIDQELYDSLKKDILCKRGTYSERNSVAIRELRNTEDALNALLKTKAENVKILKAREKLEIENHKLSILKKNIAQYKQELSAAEIAAVEAADRLKRNKSQLESIKNEDFQAIRKNLKIFRAELSVLLENISKENVSIGRLLERESTLSAKLKKMSEDKKSIAKKMAAVSTFDKLAKMFGKNGIQAVLLDTIIEDLEKTSNVILSSICDEPASIVLETQRVGSDGVSTIETLDLKVQKDGHLQSFKSLSGGEKFRISLALRIGLSDMSSRYGGSSLEFLLLDEVNSPLDRYGVETLFVNVIKALEDKYKILVITHDESLKEKFDNIIDITKVNGESSIKFTTR